MKKGSQSLKIWWDAPSSLVLWWAHLPRTKGGAWSLKRWWWAPRLPKQNWWSNRPVSKTKKNRITKLVHQKYIKYSNFEKLQIYSCAYFIYIYIYIYRYIYIYIYISKPLYTNLYPSTHLLNFYSIRGATLVIIEPSSWSSLSYISDLGTMGLPDYSYAVGIFLSFPSGEGSVSSGGYICSCSSEYVYGRGI